MRFRTRTWEFRTRAWKNPATCPKERGRSRFLKHINRIGFDGIELGIESVGGMEATTQRATELRKELEDYGTPCVAVRGGGGFHDPGTAAANRKNIEKAIDVASWLGAGIVNTWSGTPPPHPEQPGTFVGDPVSQGSSRLATEDDFERTARVLHEVGEVAGDKGLRITLEVHQNSITDNSWSTLHMLDLADSPYLFANPDLGNIFWAYEVPEETSRRGDPCPGAACEVLALQEPGPGAHPGEPAHDLPPRPAARRPDRLPLRHPCHARGRLRRLPRRRGRPYRRRPPRRSP